MNMIDSEYQDLEPPKSRVESLLYEIAEQGGGGESDDSFEKLIDRSIVTANIPSGATSIGSYAFNNCSKLTSVTIPSSVTSIGDHAFAYCSKLTSVTIPNSVTSIGGSAFAYCSKLTSVTIPNSVTSIGGSAFNNCSKLTDITVEATTLPSISSITFTNVPSTANIYVPAESVDAYKAASNWSTRANYIQAIQE